MIDRIPLFAPIRWIKIIVVSVFYWFPAWLLGFWWCNGCGSRFSYKQRKYVETASGYDGTYIIAERCKSCEWEHRHGPTN